jgi:hypothetical protein
MARPHNTGGSPTSRPPSNLTGIQKIRRHLSSLTRTMQLTRTRTCKSSWRSTVRPPGHLSSSRPCYRPPCSFLSLVHSFLSKRPPPGLISFSLCSPTLVRFLHSRFGAFWCEPSILELYGTNPLVQNRLIPSCHDPGADQGVEQPGTKSREGNPPPLFSRVKPRALLELFPPTVIWLLPLRWPPWTFTRLKKVFPLLSPI